MIDRYSLPEMAKIWDETTKYSNWMHIEKSMILSLTESGKITQDECDHICKKIDAYMDNVVLIIVDAKEREKITHHDLAAFVDALAAQIDDMPGRWIHYGLTSSDVVDTGFSMQLSTATGMVIERLDDMLDTLDEMVKKYKHTPIMGRTHGMYAEPTTFGLILFNYYSEFCRSIQRLEAAQKRISVGKLSGMVGTLSHISPEEEERALERLGLKTVTVSNQVLQRDRHAEVFNTIAILGASMEKLATQIRHMQRTEVGEVCESFGDGQKGSSAMTHKRNPILSENICGLARLLRGYATTAMENIALWHERDISHSSAERILAPDAFGIIYFMIDRLHSILENLVVSEDRMLENIHANNEIWISQTILLRLIEAGKTRLEAYEITKGAVEGCCKHNQNFYVYMKKHLRHYFTDEQVDDMMDGVSLANHYRNIDDIFDRVRETLI